MEDTQHQTERTKRRDEIRTFDEVGQTTSALGTEPGTEPRTFTGAGCKKQTNKLTNIREGEPDGGVESEPSSEED